MGYSSRATSPEGDEVGVRRAASTSMAASPNFVGGNGMSEDPSLFFFSGDADETGFSSEDFGMYSLHPILIDIFQKLKCSKIIDIFAIGIGCGNK